jgi:HEPN superfamily Swt1-like protein
MKAGDVYAFVFKGLLTEEALDRAGRATARKTDDARLSELEGVLALHFVDEEFRAPAREMAVVYTAIAAFENSVRSFVKKVLIDEHKAEWWEQGVSENIRKKAEGRQQDERHIKWHAQRGDDPMDFIDFGQLNNIIVSNWQLFEDLLRRQPWVQHILETMERSRNVIMHSGELPDEDIERIGTNLRDWMKQTGG